MTDLLLLLDNNSVKDLPKDKISRRSRGDLMSNTQRPVSVSKKAGVSTISGFRGSSCHNLDSDKSARSQFVTRLDSDKRCHNDKNKLSPQWNTTDSFNMCHSTSSHLHRSIDNNTTSNGGSTERIRKVVNKTEIAHIPQTHIGMGLLVLCCFNFPFGLVAIYCSLRAAAAYRDGNNENGAWRVRTSIVFSLVGIMLTMLFVSSVVVYIAVNKHSVRKLHNRLISSAFGL